MVSVSRSLFSAIGCGLNAYSKKLVPEHTQTTERNGNQEDENRVRIKLTCQPTNYGIK